MSCTEIHLTYDEQLEKFISRGMIAKNRNKAVERLKHISYLKLNNFLCFLWIVMELIKQILLLKQ